MPLRMVYRKDWGARDKWGKRMMRHPIENVIVWYYTKMPYCEDELSCARAVKEMQRRDLEAGLSDIRYNFVICGTGDAYEGRGWFHQPSGKLPYNSFHCSRVDMAYVGNFRGKNVLPFTMLDAHLNLVEYGIKHGYIVKNYYLIEEERKFL